MYTEVHNGILCTQEYKLHFIESILNLISIFSIHFDIRLLDFVVLASATKRRLAIGNSCIDLLLIQREREIYCFEYPVKI